MGRMNTSASNFSESTRGTETGVGKNDPPPSVTGNVDFGGAMSPTTKGLRMGSRIGTAGRGEVRSKTPLSFRTVSTPGVITTCRSFQQHILYPLNDHGMPAACYLACPQLISSPMAPHSFRISVDDLDRLHPANMDFKADRMANPRVISDEMKQNVDEYIRTLQ